jgi:hypothetical protein
MINQINILATLIICIGAGLAANIRFIPDRHSDAFLAIAQMICGAGIGLLGTGKQNQI